MTLDLKPGQVMICARPCATCPFGGGAKAIQLRPGRVEEIAAAGRFYCHTAIQRSNQAAICRGWDEAFAPNFTRVMERLGGIAGTPVLVDVNPYKLPAFEGRNPDIPNEEDEEDEEW